MAKRKYKRWVMMGKLGLLELVDVARTNGMRCICGFKVPMCVHNQIGLYGTPEQMRKTEVIWKRAGHKFTSREPSYALSINVDIPQNKWVDKGVTDAEN